MVEKKGQKPKQPSLLPVADQPKEIVSAMTNPMRRKLNRSGKVVSTKKKKEEEVEDRKEAEKATEKVTETGAETVAKPQSEEEKKAEKTEKVEKTGKTEKAAGSKMEAEQKERSETGRARRAKYEKLKKRVSELEPENFTKLYFILQKDGWFRAFGHSAIIFHYNFAPKIGVKSKLLEDKDYNYKIQGGVVNVRNMEKVEEGLNRLGMHVIKRDEQFLIFNLGRKYSLAEIQRLEEQKDREWSKVNAVALPKDSMPDLYKLLRELINKVYFKVKKMNEFDRAIMANKLAVRAADLIREYSLMAKGVGRSREEYLIYLRNSMDYMQGQLMAIAEIRAMTPEAIYQILYITQSIKRELLRWTKDKK